MTPYEILKTLRQSDIKLRVEGDDLRFNAPAGAMTGELLALIRRQKSELIEILQGSPQSNRSEAIPKAPTSDRIPLSFAQQRLWFLHQLEKNSPDYNIPAAYQLRGDLCYHALRESLKAIVRRHSILRTSFRCDHGSEPYQQVHPDPQFTMRCFDLVRLTTADREAESERLARVEALQPFDLSNGDVLRVALIRLELKEHILFITMHHIVSDGWSTGVFHRELAIFYDAIRKQQPVALPELPIQYSDFSHWQRQSLTEEIIESHLSYWRPQLDGIVPVRLSTGRPREERSSLGAARHILKLPKSLRIGLDEISQREGVTLAILFLAAFKVLLFRYTHQSDIIIGSPIANRNHPELEGLIGFFVNAIMLRTQLVEDETFLDLLSRIKTVSMEAYDHQDLPFERLVEELQPERTLGENPLFQIAFAFQNAPYNELQLHRLEMNHFPTEVTTTRCELELHIWDRSDELWCVFVYESALFDAAKIGYIANHFRKLLESIINTPTEKVQRLRLLDQGQESQIVQQWSRSRAREFDCETVQDRIQRQAKRTPDSIAIATSESAMTYRSLEFHSNRMADKLQKMGVQSEGNVAVCMERGPEVIVTLLAVLKSRAAYVPIDPDLRPEVQTQLLDESDACLVVTQESMRIRFSSLEIPILCADQELKPSTTIDELNRKSVVGPKNAAYVIFTSGTTGVPKGVTIEHRGLSNLVTAQVEAFEIDTHSRVLQFSNLGFDASVSEIFTCLTVGATLCIPTSEEMQPGPPLHKFIDTQCVTVATLIPAVWDILRENPLPTLATTVAAGSNCTARIASHYLPTTRFINAYGPTEATVCASWEPISSIDQQPLIGRPLANTEIYLVDPYGQPEPAGVVGQVFIGGMGLARGYFRQPARTAEFFVPHSFSSTPGRRLYNSGDLARWTADGKLDFCGRSDRQLKLRGFRVEPGGVETVIQESDLVKEAAVHIQEDALGPANMVCFVVPNHVQDENGYQKTGSRDIEVWPSVAEHFVYDELLYHAMSNDHVRNDAYRAAIQGNVDDKVVVDIGTGRDAILARMCVAEGARKVYAIELLEDSFRQAKENVRRLGLQDKIELIHGDSRKVELPEKGDVCVSELVGPIASMEGVVSILNDAWRFLRDGGMMIPGRCQTLAGIVSLPKGAFESPRFTAVSQHYADQVFDQVGRKFDLRLCLRNLTPSNVISNVETVEDFDFSKPNMSDFQTNVEFTISRDGYIHGLLLWLRLNSFAKIEIDTLQQEFCWLPVFFPVFDRAVWCKAGARVRGTWHTSIGKNGFNPDYSITGKLIKQDGFELPFQYQSSHASPTYCGSGFHTRLYQNTGSAIGFPRATRDHSGEREQSHENRWRALYDEIFENANDRPDPTFDTRGWVSSYTNQPIDAAEMNEWVDETVSKVCRLSPTRVLEIGCGTGLLVHRLAPRSKRYVGTDFSSAALDSLRSGLTSRPGLEHVELQHRKADEFHGFDGNFDTIILNSVVQYFPSREYLILVMEGAIRLLDAGGCIFLGDVRHLQLAKAFHATVQLDQAPDETPVADVFRESKQRFVREQELLVQPEFFFRLRSRWPEITHIEVVPKTSPANNELTKFRYDVVLHVRKPIKTTECDWIDWDNDSTLKSIRDSLLTREPNQIGIRGIPNGRIANDLMCLEHMRSAKVPTAGELRRLVHIDSKHAETHPAKLIELLSDWGYDATISLSPDCDRFDMLLTRTGEVTLSKAFLSDWNAGRVSSPEDTNVPLLNDSDQSLVTRLRHELSLKLPEHMIPASIRLIDSLPRTASGKIDYAELPVAGEPNHSDDTNFRAPRNRTESTLERIWQEILGIQQIGIDRSFFHVGGHSLLATQLVSRIRDEFQVEMPLRDVFAAPTIEGMAISILTQQASQVDTATLAEALAKLNR